MATTKASAAQTEADPQSDASAAAQAEQPTKAPPAAAAPSAPTVPDVPGHKPGGVFEYVDATPSTTLFQGFPPQSADYGDVCLLPYDPQLPRWERSTRAVSRQPDTHLDEVEATSAAQSEARAAVHAAALQAQLDAAAAQPADSITDTKTGV
jgi:hypothetical protein